MSASFGDRLRELRKAAGLTQQELATAAGLTISVVTKSEAGVQEPSWRTVRLLARALKVSVAAFDVDDEPAPGKKPRKKK